MSKPKILSLLIAVGVLALAFVLNPSPDKHRATIKDVIAERSPLEHLLGIGQLTSFVARYHSLGLASYTTVDGKLISVGIFGLVFIPD